MAYEVGFPPNSPRRNDLRLPSPLLESGEGGDFGYEEKTMLFELNRFDCYALAFEKILRCLEATEKVRGMISWLRDAHPNLYGGLTETLPNDLQRLWSEHAPLEQFDALIARWLKTHTTACELFKTSVANRSASQTWEKRTV